MWSHADKQCCLSRDTPGPALRNQPRLSHADQAWVTHDPTHPCPTTRAGNRPATAAPNTRYRLTPPTALSALPYPQGADGVELLPSKRSTCRKPRSERSWFILSSSVLHWPKDFSACVTFVFYMRGSALVRLAQNYPHQSLRWMRFKYISFRMRKAESAPLGFQTANSESCKRWSPRTWFWTAHSVINTGLNAHYSVP